MQAARTRSERPPALPPETRTVGQLVAETVQLYRQRFWISLPLGLSVAVLDQITFERTQFWQLVLSAAIGGVLLTVSYIGASLIVAGQAPSLRGLDTAFAGGILAFLPAPFLIAVFVLPGLAWLALVGLVVPVATIEQRGLGDAFRRAIQLARADYVHALGALSTLVITYVITRLVLVVLLHDSAGNVERVASFLADLVLSPILFLGAALLY
ncbi:MAG: hypothetical protein M3M94_05125, partial [Actinomycetota bacterium]|nr:hypothetical protein [Actinomycetota bacterium]